MNRKIKTGWEDVTLEDYVMIESIRTDERLDIFEKEIRLLCFLNGVADDFFDDYTLTEIKEFFSAVSWIDQEPKGNIQDYYTIAGKEYKLIHNVKDIKANQLADYNHYMKDPEDLINNFHSVCAIFLLPTINLSRKHRLFNRFYKLATSHPKGQKWIEKKGVTAIVPQTEKYDPESAPDLAEIIFKTMPVTDVMGIFHNVFFCTVISIRCLLDSSRLTMSQQLQSVAKSLNSELETKSNPQMMKLTTMITELQTLETIGDGLL